MSEFRHSAGPGPGDGREGRKPPQRGGPQRRPQVPLPAGRPFRTLAFWMLVVLLSLVAYRMYQGSFMAPQRVEVSYTRFIRDVDAGNIANLQITESTVTGELKKESTVKINNHDVAYKAFLLL